MKSLKLKNLFSLVLVFILSFFLFACNKDEANKEVIEEAYASVLGGVDLTKVEEDLILPMKVGEVLITWESSNEDVLTNSGIVTRQNGDSIVILTATLKYNGTEVTKTETVIILGLHEATTYTATVKNVENGQVTLSKTSGINVSETITITVTPNTGYKLEWLKVNGQNVTVINNRASVVVNENIVVTASFIVNTITPITYTASVSNVTNGQVTLSKTTGITAGESITITVTPNTGYELEWLKVNGETVTVTNNIATVVVNSNITVTASFKTTNSGSVDTNDLASILAKYENYEDWNFAVNYYWKDTYDDSEATTLYEYDGYNFSLEYDYEGVTYVEYVVYEGGAYYYYYDNGDGTYTKLADGDEGYSECIDALDYLELSGLSASNFSFNGTYYTATDINTIGNLVLGEFENGTWTTFNLYVSNGYISKIVAVNDYEGYDIEFELIFSKFGSVDVVVPNAEDGGNDNTGTENPGGNGGSETATSYTSTFTDQNLTVGSGELEYTASRTAYDGWDAAGRGVQFVQSGGPVTITSKNSLSGVNSVTVVVSTNNTTGMEVSVKVGTVSLTYNGADTVSLKKSDGNNLSFTFTGSNLSGNVNVTLTPLGTGQSMYISSISINGGSTGGNTGGSTGGSTGTGTTMTSPTFDSTKEDYRLNEAYTDKDNWNMLASTGTYDVLVVPVQFKNATGTSVITDEDLANLDTAFNGKDTTNTTGWESVTSYYYKSSFGKLNLSFDIQSVYTAYSEASAYEDEEGPQNLMLEVLAYLENKIDLTEYDYNNDGVLDGIYLIYSEPVDWNGNSNWWAFVSWYYLEGAADSDYQKFDGLEVNSYLFAGLDFMDEESGSGVTINASTYIHETGHMLGLDDYYDYDMTSGSNQGIGGADMMDATVGDHNPYSKIMLDWITPTKVTETQTFTINPAESSGDCLMILLDGDGTYFSEYLLIDLYTNTGLNEMHADIENSYLYYGVEYGVRVYHVSSSIENPYSDNYGSFTDNNNSVSTKPLIKLIEADGEVSKNSTSNNGAWAEESDLWTTGKVFSNVWGSYTRYDGAKLNFDISFDSVTKTSATITITFN